MLFSFMYAFENKPQQNQQEPNLKEQRIKYINDTLNKMNSSEFQYCEALYKQESWVVWLDDFTPDAKVRVTNEWSHIFHSRCLKTWYYNIRINRKLVWPHWATENSPNSKPPESCEFPSILHVHFETVPSSFITSRPLRIIGDLSYSDRI